MRGSDAWWLAALGWLITVSAAEAHQPVMDMAPRWSGGYGFQVRYEFSTSDEIRDGTDEVSNRDDREKTVHTTWLEGVYTWRREVRATFKLPVIDQQRDARVEGEIEKQSGAGVGDLVVALPLKKYWNFSGSTANLGFTPSLRLPTGSTSDSYPVGDGSTDLGLGLSFAAENPLWYMMADLFFWKNEAGRRGIDQGDQLGFDLNLGLHPYHDNARNLGTFVMLDLEVRSEGRGVDTGGTTGGDRVTLGPVLVGYWNNVMARAEVKLPVYEKVHGTQFSRGPLINVGIGMTF